MSSPVPAGAALASGRGRGLPHHADTNKPAVASPQVPEVNETEDESIKSEKVRGRGELIRSLFGFATMWIRTLKGPA